MVFPGNKQTRSTGPGAAIAAIPATLMIFLIKAYRFILSPWIGNQCRFHPTCSHYAEEAICSHGALKGGVLTLRRLGKCHPWHEGGCDPVPPPRF